MSRLLAAMPPWAWAAVIITAIAILFAGIFWLSRRIEPDQRHTDNDEWLKHGE